MVIAVVCMNFFNYFQTSLLETNIMNIKNEVWLSGHITAKLKNNPTQAFI